MRQAAAVVTMLALWLSLAVGAHAQDFPARQVTFVVPLGAGGAMDIIARILANKLSARLGQPFVVENRTGGGTVVAAVHVAKAAPDGYTLLFAPSGTLTTNVALYKKLAYDPINDFVPVALLVKVPFVLVINPSLPVWSIPDLVRYAKEKPGELSFGSTGTGAVPHLAGELLKASLGIDLIHVPYKGAIPALTDVVGGHVQLTFADPSLTSQLVGDGKVRALGVSSLSRIDAFPEIPPLADVGVPNFEAVSWHLVVAPAHTPDAIVNKLHEEMKAIMATPEVRKQIVTMGLIPVDSPSVDDLKKFLASELARWGKLVNQAGITGSE